VDENPMGNQEYVSDVPQFQKMFCLGRCGRNGMVQWVPITTYVISAYHHILLLTKYLVI
jgi:hypothetical protein